MSTDPEKMSDDSEKTDVKITSSPNREVKSDATRKKRKLKEEEEEEEKSAKKPKKPRILRKVVKLSELQTWVSEIQKLIINLEDLVQQKGLLNDERVHVLKLQSDLNSLQKQNIEMLYMNEEVLDDFQGHLTTVVETNVNC
jgi:hypothetical protein